MVNKFRAMIGFNAGRGRSLISEIIFEVREDEVDGGFTASALGFGIHTQADTVEELRTMVKEAVNCYFDESMERPKLIRLHFVRDEVLVQ
jgi:predicted RNase H-like HicB family nuclease